MMTFKALTAALTLLLLLTGGLPHRAVSATRSTATSPERHFSIERGAAGPAAAHGSLQNATLFNGVAEAARHAGRSARTHVPEPKVLLLLGLALVLFGIRRSSKQDRNPPRPDR